MTEAHDTEGYDGDGEYESVRRFHIWHLIILLIVVVVAAVLLVYFVMPFVASLLASSATTDLLPNAVQA